MMKSLKPILLIFGLFLGAVAPVFSQDNSPSWGDQGNGTYINPVLNADYSDPDVIRVGDDFYMVCSEFHYMGMPVLHSRDLVNWTIIGQVYREFKFDPKYDAMDRYAKGSWAPAIRFHDGLFFVYFCTPAEGLFMSTAEKPEGPWTPLTQVSSEPRWEDPCPFWDEDGQAYLGHSCVGAGPIIIHKLSPDGKTLLDNGVTVYTGPIAEGTKFHKLGEYYYLSIPEGGVRGGWQTILRSKNIYGPFEKKVVLETGSTSINGPHQGAMIDTPGGQWWFLHFQEVQTMGRVVHLQPMFWKDGWPVVGVDIDRNGIGEPVYVWKKPETGGERPITAPQSSDEFNVPELSLQWQWNHNPVDGAWSLTSTPGHLTLGALQADSLKNARNTLAQKIMGPRGQATTLMKTDKMQDGQKAGLCLIGKEFNEIGVTKRDGALFIYVNLHGEYLEQPLACDGIQLKAFTTEAEGANQFYYSADGDTFAPLGGTFPVQMGFWKGPHLGLFSYNEKEPAGAASFDWFHYDYDGPQSEQ